MVSFSISDYLIIFIFFAAVLLFGFYFGRQTKKDANDYLLSGRKVGLFLFILTNVSTWYGGILGIGEFTYRYGLMSWFTQGFPYYLFAFLFAILFAKKIRTASLFTIPDKLSQVYDKKVGLASAVLVFVLVSPAPYLLMTANLLSLIFGTGMIVSLVIGVLLSVLYLLNGGFRANIYADAIQFFVMFGGFIVVVFIAASSLGGFSYLHNNLPPDHLQLTGGASPTYIIVWFLIALWTFADPGFHQRCYAAKDGNTAAKGIIISIFFFALFDFLTTTTGLYARALLPNLKNPVLSFPLFAEKILGPGIKGIFYAAMFATIMSTLNSFFFLSGTTIGRDFIFRFKKKGKEEELKYFTVIGLLISGIVSIIVAYFIPSVIEIWYTIGSFCIPGIIFPIISSYYPKLKIDSSIILLEIISSVLLSVSWFFIRQIYFSGNSFLSEIEPMLVGLSGAILIHLWGLLFKKPSYSSLKV
ncbi:MAG: sodium:solute symporter family protein [Bacteroidetes bacterium]|nr:sodium:solute symporter family protein [Bacteroidota bacterium]